jgi:hypothetical protein
VVAAREEVAHHPTMKTIRRQLGRILAWLFGTSDSDRPTEATGSAQAAEMTDWCLIGNVVEEHAFGESEEIRRGSKQFTAGTKVYCLPPQWGDGYERVVAVGICRGSRRWITVVMRAELITNWRAKVVYKPAVLRRLREGFDGFKRQWESKEQVESFAQELRQRAGLGK